MNAVTHLEKVITGEVSAVTHLEKVIAGETSAVTYTEKVITGEAPPITHLQKVIAGEASPVTHLEYVWAGRTPEPTEHEYTGVVPYSFNADGTPLLDWYIKGNTVQNGTPTPDSPIMPQGTGDLETSGAKAGQYKIPISSANTTTPVYLGVTETTRQVKKLVFDGTENWYTAVSSTCLFGIQKFEPMQVQPFIPGYSAISNCYVYNPVQSGVDAATVSGEFAMQAFRAGSSWQYNFFIKDGRYDSLIAWKAYLAQQYTNGTPVTIWYVLATPETAVVNEPLRKIGDYADTLSMEQAGVSIPTNNGSTTVDVETTLKPSEVYIKYKGV